MKPLLLAFLILLPGCAPLLVAVPSILFTVGSEVECHDQQDNGEDVTCRTDILKGDEK